jgi:hypothetical protein
MSEREEEQASQGSQEHAPASHSPSEDEQVDLEGAEVLTSFKHDAVTSEIAAQVSFWRLKCR